MRRISTFSFAASVLLAAAPLAAQGRGRNVDGVPPGHRPPAGMCRVWIDGVPPGRQPAVTDCATAQAQASRTANARVIYGSSSSGDVSTRRNRNCTTDVLGRVTCTTRDGTLTRERTSDGRIIWRDANGNIIRETRVDRRDRDRDDDDRIRDRDDDDDEREGRSWKGERGDNGKHKGKHKGKKHDD